MALVTRCVVHSGLLDYPFQLYICVMKDRRPLAPAAVAKMVVKREDDSIVDPELVSWQLSWLNFNTIDHIPFSDVDCSFFLVTVDLWSADGKHEMNLVLHPTSSDRYVPATAPKVKRKTTNSSSGPTSQRSGRQSPTPSGPPSTTSQYPQVWESADVTGYIGVY